MEAEHEKSKKAKTQKAPAEQDRSGEQASNKVPENAENFEHVLRRLTIEKNQAKRRS